MMKHTAVFAFMEIQKGARLCNTGISAIQPTITSPPMVMLNKAAASDILEAITSRRSIDRLPATKALPISTIVLLGLKTTKKNELLDHNYAKPGKLSPVVE